MTLGQSEVSEELSLRYTLQENPHRLPTDYINKMQPWRCDGPSQKNAWNERRKLEGQIKDGGIKRNGCEDRHGKVVRGKGVPMWLSLSGTVWGGEAEICHTNSPAQVNPGSTDRGERYQQIQISTCEVFLTGGCLSISGSCVSLLRATSSLAFDSLLWQGRIAQELWWNCVEHKDNGEIWT